MMCNLSSATMAELIKNDQRELANANTFGTKSELELGCGKRKCTANMLYNTKLFSQHKMLIQTKSNHFKFSFYYYIQWCYLSTSNVGSCKDPSHFLFGGFVYYYLLKSFLPSYCHITWMYPANSPID